MSICYGSNAEPTTGVTVSARKSFMLSSWFGALYRYIEPGINREAFIPVMEIAESSVADGHSLSELARLQTGVRLSQMFLHHVHFWRTLFVLCGISIAIPLCLVSRGHPPQTIRR